LKTFLALIILFLVIKYIPNVLLLIFSFGQLYVTRQIHSSQNKNSGISEFVRKNNIFLVAFVLSISIIGLIALTVLFIVIFIDFSRHLQNSGESKGEANLFQTIAVISLLISELVMQLVLLFHLFRGGYYGYIQRGRTKMRKIK
jgi:ABC-type sugar transport system permease subunit